MLIRSNTISYASNKAKRLREYEEEIKKELNDITVKLDQAPDENLQQQYNTNIKEPWSLRNVLAFLLEGEREGMQSEWFSNKNINLHLP
jgi:hypothetical protein